jgi:hypothetical protein
METGEKTAPDIREHQSTLGNEHPSIDVIFDSAVRYAFSKCQPVNGIHCIHMLT